MNCQIRGLTSIRKGLGKDETPFLVNSNSIKASENVSGRVSGENLKSPERLFLQIRRGPNFANPEGSNFANPEGSSFANPEGSNFANLEGSHFCQSGGVLFLPIRRGPYFCQSGGVPIFANPEGSYSCQSGGVLFCHNLRRQDKRK